MHLHLYLVFWEFPKKNLIFTHSPPHITQPHNRLPEEEQRPRQIPTITAAVPIVCNHRESELTGGMPAAMQKVARILDSDLCKRFLTAIYAKGCPNS
ncbi:hypothetical protein HanXRQr2_Chr02g0068921 [Helianthus annuus]|uniref:Uncharacterized protein n=1 Tax=Helianthus annuus TaxID=4232 RepID=A0A9K3JQD0_HELAN|nr:hypothetical protein HanXRQr2_Chr02g0068921 [Helianthus annuus]KAJ0604929.1 hypothetical protein HanHA300_Chr02g0057281 [Helianthus annuus]KAJ0618944.1 hypothetical protein HanHA89_Chr02g0065781 [Helianthus annuus]KAJ0952002.1 hypothetical protein HanPSC8_Chr02g0067071 [Helianthus annuus]